MKKLKLFFALFAMLALGVGNAWAEDVTFSWSGSATADAGKTDYVVEQTPVTLTFAAGTAQNAPRTNKEGSVRMYANTTLTISCASGNITKVTFTPTSASYNATKLKYNGTALTSDEWTLSSPSNEVTLTASANARFKTIVVTYTSAGSGETPEPDPDPTPDPEPDPDPAPGTGGTGTINFNSSAVKINAASVTGNDDLGNTWTITTVGTTSYTASNAYYQVGSGSKPATSITFTTTLPSDVNVTAFSAKFGGFNGTAGAVTLKVDDTSVGTGSLNATSDVTISNSSQATGKKLTVTLTGIAKGVKVYYISYTYTTSSGGSEPETPATDLNDAQFAWSAATAEATMGASNTFPTLTNTLPVSVTYESSTTATATIDATSGAITLVAPGATTISAKFAGGEVSGTTYAPKTVTYALTVLKAPATPTGTMYVKVTDAVTDGEYLIVYEDAANNPQSPVAFNGALTTLDAVSNTIEVKINSNTIAGNTDIDAAIFTIDVTNGTILSASGKYIGKTANSNGLDVKTTAMTNTFAIDANGNAVITGNTAALRYNKAADQKRFRYYKDGGGSQEKIALYKKASSHTLTYGTCEKGSVSANVADGATVLSGTTITLSNTPTTDYKLSAYDVYKTGDETTKVTVTNGKFIMPEFDVTISATFVPAKTLTSIEITSAATQTTFWQGETFNHNGLKVTAHFDGADDEDVTDKVTVTGSTATAGAAVEVTVSFTEGTTTKTTEYDITVKATANTTETAYDVAIAREIIDKVSSANDIYVQGIVSKIVTAYNSTYGNITYDISADGLTTSVQLQAYRGKSFNGDPFTSADDVKVGDEVVVFGNLLKYNSTYELAENNKLISLNRNKAVAGLAYETKEYTAKVNEAFSTPTLTNPNTLTVTYKTSDATLATVDATTGEVTIGNKAGKVTITASFAGNDDYVAGEASYNITITDPNQLEATFVAATDLGNTTRGEGSIAKSPITFACSDGVLGNGSEYRLYQDANITFAAENGYAITKVVLTSTASGDSQYGPAKLSAEDGTYTYSGKEGTWVGEAYTVTLTATAQTRATLITVYYKQDNRVDAGIAWNPATVSLTVGEEFTAPTFSNPNSVTVNFESSNTELATVSNAGVISLVSGKTGTATITATYVGNETYKPAEVTCVITVSPKTEKVVILAQYEGQWYAMKAQYVTGKTSHLAPLSVTYFDGKLYNVSEEDKALIEWECAVVDGKATFYNNGKYLSGISTETNLTLATTACEWTISGDSYLIGARTFLYNAENNWFRNFGTSNAGNKNYSDMPTVTAPVYATGDIVYTRAVTPGNLGTICLPFNVPAGKASGATFYTLAGMDANGRIAFDEVTTGELVAGKSYLFQANAAEIVCYCGATSVPSPDNTGAMKGTFGYLKLTELSNIYYFADRALWSCADLTELSVPANRAYVDMDDMPAISESNLAPGVRRITLGVNGQNTATGVDQVQGDNVPTKMIINGQLFIIRGEKMYDAQGKLVK